MKLPTWRVDQLAGKRRPRRSNNAAVVLAKLQDGAALYSGRIRDGRWWALDDGTVLAASTAKVVISNPNVVDCGDSLFEGVRGQVFRFVEEPKGEEP
jgi:hypothetical protein